MSGATPTIAIVVAPGSNRDGEAARAVHLAGGRACTVPVGAPLDRFDGVILPGGFSYGDALGAGTRWALEAGESITEFTRTGKPVLGICNGFQVLVRAGLLPAGPAPTGAGSEPAAAPPGPARSVTLTVNARGRFVCRWVTLAVEPGNVAGLADVLPARIACPVAHGEGRLAVRDAGTLERLERGGNVLFRYADSSNPNGSVADIAGLCDDTGLVWGLMPHPEDHVTEEQNPFPQRRGRSGLPLFRALVDRARTI